MEMSTQVMTVRDSAIVFHAIREGTRVLLRCLLRLLQHENRQTERIDELIQTVGNGFQLGSVNPLGLLGGDNGLACPMP